MPEHHFLFAKPSELIFQAPTVPGGPERICVSGTHGLQLRRLSADESTFSPIGSYRQAYVILPNYQASGLIELFGFQVQTQLSGSDRSNVFGGSVEFQLSNDGGSTWMAYEGGSWVTATTWMTESVVDTNIDTFPLTGSRQFRVKLRLTPAQGGGATPLVKRVTLFVTLDYDYQEDVRRSMKHHIEREMRVKTVWYQTVVDQGRIEPEHQWEGIFSPVSAFNLTTDPGRTTNLFSAIDGKGVLLSSAQTGEVEVTLHSRPPVFLAAEDFFQISTIPSVVVTMPTTKERRDLRNGNGETDICVGRERARVWLARVYFESDVRVTVQSSLELESLRMAEAIDRILTHDKIVLSEASGEDMAVTMATPISVTNRVPVGLYVKEFSATLFGKAWLRPDVAKDEYLAREVVALVGSVGGRSFETVEV